MAQNLICMMRQFQCRDYELSSFGFFKCHYAVVFPTTCSRLAVHRVFCMSELFKVVTNTTGMMTSQNQINGPGFDSHSEAGFLCPFYLSHPRTRSSWQASTDCLYLWPVLAITIEKKDHKWIKRKPLLSLYTAFCGKRYPWLCIF